MPGTASRRRQLTAIVADAAVGGFPKFVLNLKDRRGRLGGRKAKPTERASMDYRIYHAINVFVSHHGWLGRALSFGETWAVPLIAIATISLWFFARRAVIASGSSRRRARCAVPRSASSSIR